MNDIVIAVYHLECGMYEQEMRLVDVILSDKIPEKYRHWDYICKCVVLVDYIEFLKEKGEIK